MSLLALEQGKRNEVVRLPLLGVRELVRMLVKHVPPDNQEVSPEGVFSESPFFSSIASSA